MKLKPIFYPGLGETKRNYRSLSKYLRIADIDWNTGKTTPAGDCNTIVSFSLGVVFALHVATRKKLRKLILCSPTPFESLGKYRADEVVFVIGEQEKFLQEIFKPLCKGSVRMVIVPGADHKINRVYQNILLDLLDDAKTV